MGERDSPGSEYCSLHSLKDEEISESSSDGDKRVKDENIPKADSETNVIIDTIQSSDEESSVDKSKDTKELSSENIDDQPSKNKEPNQDKKCEVILKENEKINTRKEDTSKNPTELDQGIEIKAQPICKQIEAVEVGLKQKVEKSIQEITDIHESTDVKPNTHLSKSGDNQSVTKEISVNISASSSNDSSKRDEPSESDRDVSRTSKDVIKSPQDVSRSSDDVLKSPQGVSRSSDDVLKSPQDVARSSDDVIKSPPQDVARSSDDVIKSPQDVSGSSDDVIKSPQDVSRTPQQVFSFSPDLATSSHHISSKDHESPCKKENFDETRRRSVSVTERVPLSQLDYNVSHHFSVSNEKLQRPTSLPLGNPPSYMEALRCSPKYSLPSNINRSRASLYGMDSSSQYIGNIDDYLEGDPTVIDQAFPRLVAVPSIHTIHRSAPTTPFATPDDCSLQETIIPVREGFENNPCAAFCKECQITVLTTTSTKYRSTTYCCCFLMFFSGVCCPLSFLPFLLCGPKKVFHACPKCKNVMGIYVGDN